MNNTELKEILSTKHINSWVKIYKDSSDIQDYLFLLYGTRAESAVEIYGLFYLVMNDLPEKPKAYCGSDSKFIKYGRGYATFCDKYERSLKQESCSVCHDSLYKVRNEKTKITNYKIYGNEIPQQTESVKNKVKDTNLEKYGHSSHNSNQEVKNKKVETMMDNYGISNPSQLQATKDVIISSNLKKYGTEHYLQSNERYENDIKTRYNRVLDMCSENNVIPVFSYEDFKKSSRHTYLKFKCNDCDNEYDSQTNTRISKCSCKKLSGTSLQENDLLQYIKSLIPEVEVLTNVRDVISPKELDIYIPSMKLAFEYNGMYWHSTEHKSEKYHQEKVLACNENGINLIHIFEDEWNSDDKNAIIKERIKNKIHTSTVIYARKCKILPVHKEVAASFLNNHHIQGNTQSPICIGLYYEDSLCALMTFGKSRFDKTIQYELIRYCSSGTVVGGASKLLKHFEKTYNPTSLMTYADMNWSTGNLYDKLGFEFDTYTVPGYFYYDPATKERISRQRCQKHKLIKKGFDSSLTEKHICCNILGYYKIYDSGNLKYIKRY